MKTRVLTFLFLLAWLPARSQADKVLLKNPSFEDEPKASHVPQGWSGINSFGQERLPDIQPGHFGCNTKPLRGNCYLGLVTCDNNTTERIIQGLESSLLADVVYDFSVCLATSRRYKSNSRATGREVNYSDPVRLRIWGYNLAQGKKAMMAESPIVTNHEWVRYRFQIRPPGFDIQAIELEAWYGTNLPTNGNLLLDNCSAFVPKFVADTAVIAEAVFKPKPLEALRLIELYNPSFELAPIYFLPFGWEDTAGEITTWVRAHPYQKPRYRSINGPVVQIYSGMYAQEPPTKKKAVHGERYLSLLASEKKKRQQVSQHLAGLLKRDSIYSFSLHMARSKEFWENLESRDQQADYKNPLRLRIWGGTKETPNAELLAVSPSVVSTDWRKFDFVLQPLEGDYDWITLEAWYVSDFGEPYNGNILLDNLSAIEMLVRD